jgi:hypothetical protein
MEKKTGPAAGVTKYSTNPLLGIASEISAYACLVAFSTQPNLSVSRERLPLAHLDENHVTAARGAVKRQALNERLCDLPSMHLSVLHYLHAAPLLRRHLRSP